ncbi:MAG: hypothetical protein HY237_12340 [Acidobacteria bacterium]|nr:hypothetical protein [Acidobacteriota bacterium]
MSARKTLAVLAAAVLAFSAAGSLKGQQPRSPAEPRHGQMQGMDHQHSRSMDPDQHAEHGAMQSMTPGHHHRNAHMKMTAPRPQTPEDLARADAIVRELRAGIEKYKDYRVALGDGFQIFLPNLPQPQYHFTNYKNGFLEAFTFDPARPTSLLYKKTASGYELLGAMYTMPRTATEDQLNARVPLSVGTWHLHVNLCMPPRGQGARADWTKFGLAGSISTPDACEEAGGNFLPAIFGWMIHVYPYEDSREKTWAHPA